MRQEIVFRDEYFEINYFGAAEIQEVFQITESLLKNPSFTKNSKYLVDYSGLESFDESSLHLDDLESFALPQRKAAQRAERVLLARVGLPNLDKRALANVWESLCEHYRIDMEAEDFQSRDKAIEWLESR